MNKLSDRMWITRKARINMEKRLLLDLRIYTYLIPWYSILLIAVSVLPSAVNTTIKNSISVMGSIIVLVASLLLSQRDYRQECRLIKEQYIKIVKLIHDAIAAEANNESTDAIENEYCLLLQSTENHSEYDYKKVVIECKLRKKANPNENYTVPSPCFFDWVYFTIYTFGFWLLVTFIFVVFPIGICLWLLK